jgi:hypothetical protein
MRDDAQEMRLELLDQIFNRCAEVTIKMNDP